MEFLRNHQLNIMLFLSGICAVLALLAFCTKALSSKQRRTIGWLELLSSLLLIADRFAYIYRGDTSTLGWWMVRISNFLVFFLSLFNILIFNQYIKELLYKKGGIKNQLIRLQCVDVLCIVGLFYIVFSQFTGLYYTFDEMNRYQRSPGFLLCYLFPVLSLFIITSVTIQYSRKFSKLIRYPLQLFSILPIIATVVQVFAYGLSLTNISIVFTVTLIYIFVLLDLNKTVEKARQQELEFLKHEKQNLHTMFEQTTEALAKAIDAKDEYTNGHSRRVAEYSKQIAKAAGKTEEECDKTYFAALLHDVGKIGVPIQILSKNGKLTEQEFEQIKSHPVVGGDILSSIKESPWLSLGARYHHEKYNGKGYPDGLKGTDIPEIARIIAVADAYDAMTSNRSYRKSIPQHIVREEFVKGIGSQFDPDFAKMMIHMIDLDTEYKMKESITGANLTARTNFHCDSIYNECSMGFGITPLNATISFCSKPDEGVSAAGGLPTLIVFDALDGNVHPGEENNRNLMYLEYAQIRLDGKIIEKNVRKSEVRINNQTEIEKQDSDSAGSEIKYKVEAVRNQDHVYLRISGGNQFFEVLLALPDISRYAFLSISGQHCSVHDISVQVDDKPTPYDSIPRIAPEISYIKDQPQGDIPNIQSNGYRLSSTNSIPVADQMEISFHTMSYPTARLIWHCPFICLFSSSNGKLDDPYFCEYQLLRLDGESDPSDERVKNEVLVEQTECFKGWETWKEENRKGLDCKISIKKENNKIIIQTENLGLKIKSESVILNDAKNLYVALTGDQCAITNIHIEVMKNEQTI